MAFKRKAVAYAVLLALALIFASYFGGFLPHVILRALFALPFLLAAFVLLVNLLLKHHQQLETRFVVKGAKLKYTLKVSNETILPFPAVEMLLHDTSRNLNLPASTGAFSLGAFSSRVFEYDFSADYRGVFLMGARKVKAWDMLGVLGFGFGVREPLELIVYPRLLSLDCFGYTAVDSSLAETRTTLEEDFESPLAPRKYTTHDSQRRIHWRLSAHRGELMVKTFSSQSGVDVTVLLDLSPVPCGDEHRLFAEDAVIESALAVSSFFLQRFARSGVARYANGDIVTELMSTKESFNQFYKFCAGAKFDAKIDAGHAVETILRRTQGHANLSVVTANLSPALYDALVRADSLGHIIELIWVAAEPPAQNSPHGRMLEKLANLGVLCYLITPGSDIKTVLESGG